MNKILYILMFFVLSQANYAQSPQFSCELSAADNEINLGGIPYLQVQIKNISDSNVHLIQPLDGSSYLWRYPLVYFTIKKLNDTTDRSKLIPRCGNLDGVDTNDFVLLQPNECYKLFSYNRSYFDPYTVSNPENFNTVGKYKIQFHYSTISADIQDYMGDDMVLKVYELKQIQADSLHPPILVNQIKSEYIESIKVLEALFQKVSKVEIVSNEIIIEVK